MKQQSIISGFSSFDRKKKVEIASGFSSNSDSFKELVEIYRNNDCDIQKLHDEFIENSLTNFYLPYGVAPNFLVNDKFYMVPMVTEESSVVAAASKSARFWASRGGFIVDKVIQVKTGQVHFFWNGKKSKLLSVFPQLKALLIEGSASVTANMKKRGGGIISIQLLDKTSEIENYYQIEAAFNTCESMGANFINSCLEEFSEIIKLFFKTNNIFSAEEKEIEILMAILSNHTPGSLVKVSVSCPVTELNEFSGEYTPEDFARRFSLACKIASTDINRAVTHNKGIFNGIDSVVVATGNDFRAVEAGGHAYASRSGQYRGLSDTVIEDGIFKFSLTVPLSIGTVGGVTSLHPMAKLSLSLLGNPQVTELMGIIASVGLASNFAAIASLITKGIQNGHMKMHLVNILNFFKAETEERDKAISFFKNRRVTFSEVEGFINDLRDGG